MVRKVENENINGWTVETLKEYIDTLIDKHEKFNDQKFYMTKEAVLKSEQLNEKRLDAMNQFREQLKDQSTTFLTKEVYNVEHRNLLSKVESVTKIVYIGIGLISIIEIAIGFVIALIVHK